jgi:hypothetical protein
MVGTIKKLEKNSKEQFEGKSLWYCDGTLRGCIQLLNIDYVSHAEGNEDVNMSREMLQELGIEIKGKLYKAMWDRTNKFTLDEEVFHKLFYKAFEYTEKGKKQNDFNKYFEIVSGV